MTYQYADDDLRVARTVAGSTTTYLWDRGAGLPELVDDGTTISLQTGNGIQAKITKSSNADTYPLLDGQGSVRAETDGSRTPGGSAAYDPWGILRGSVTTSSQSGWTGGGRDATTGFTDLRVVVESMPQAGLATNGQLYARANARR